MKVLFVSPYLPSRRSGGPVRLRGLARELARSHSVSMLALTPPRPDEAALADTRTWCDEVVTVPNARFARTRMRKRAAQLASLARTGSTFRLVHQRAALQHALDRLAARTRYDVVQVETSFMTHYAFPRGVPIVVDEHNVEYEILRRTAGVAGVGARAIFSAIDAYKLRREEERCWRSVDACAVTSERDARVVRESAPAARVAVVPNGVDTEHVSPRGVRADPSTILFFGTLSYYPNTDGLLFFVREVLPLIRRTHPNARLVVVGRDPPPELVREARPDVVLTGEVPDIRPHVERARVVVAPLRIGGGTRLKILEAMALARPVVATTIGAEGLAVTHERDILIADDGPTLASHIGRVLDDDALATRLGAAARALVVRNYDWSASTRVLASLHAATIEARRATSSERDARAPLLASGR